MLNGANQIEGDLIFNADKSAILLYNNGFIPYTNSEENIFGIIDSRTGYNLELENGKKIIDVFPTYFVQGIEIFLYDDITNTEKDRLEEKLKKISGVNDVEYKSKEDALQSMKEQYKDNPEIFAGYEGENNIFPASYILKFESNEDIKNAQKEIEKWNDKNIKNITVSNLDKNSDENIFKEIYWFDMIIKDGDKYCFATNDIAKTIIYGESKLEYYKEKYLDIYCVRDSNSDIQGFIAEKESNKKVFLNKSRKELTSEYKFMNYIELDSDCFIVCSNSKIKTIADLNNSEFTVYDVKGNLVDIENNEFIDMLDLNQGNYNDKNSVEYILFK